MLAAHFCRINTCQIRFITKCRGMDDTKGDYSQEDKIQGVYVHFGMGGTNSNGHGEGKDDNMNMVETIRKFQKAVQSHKDDNERLMKDKEQ
jgi:hypothetical protein